MPGQRSQSCTPQPRGWTFLTNHAYVLLALYEKPTIRQREIATIVGITEGAVQRLLRDLIATGHVEVERTGRRNRYRVKPDVPMRHPIDTGRPVARLLSIFDDEIPNRRSAGAPS